MSDSRLSTRLRMLLLAAGCAAILGLAACGGDDATTTTSSSTTTPAGATGASSTDTGGSTATGDASTLRDQFNQQLLQVLTTSQGLTQEQAQCAIDALEQSVSDQDLQDAIAEAAQTGEPPQDLIDAGFAAGQQCSGQ